VIRSEHRRRLVVGALFAATVLSLTGCHALLHLGGHAAGHAGSHGVQHMEHEWEQNQDTDHDGYANKIDFYDTDPNRH
jgi:hypothetical protein